MALVEDWTCDEVITWLTEKKLVFWAKEFQACKEEGLEIDGLTLEQIDEKSLYEDFPNSWALCRKQLVAKIGQAKKQINARNQAPSPAETAPATTDTEESKKKVQFEEPEEPISNTPPKSMPAPTPHPSSSNPTVQYQEQNQGDANEPPKKSAAKPMTSPAINANSVAATPGQKKRPSIFRWESMLGQTPRVNGMPAATPPAPISMRQLQYEPSMKNIYREMSINELKKIEPASADAFTEEFQQKAMDYGLLTVDEDSVSAPPAPPMPPIDGKSAPKAKSKAGPAPAEKIRQLQSQMSFRVPMLSPRTAVHFAALPPEYNEDLLNKMSTERTGEEMDSAQTILGLHAVIKGKGANYRFDSQKGLDPVPKPKKDVTVKVMKKEFEEVRVPHVKIEGTWIADMLDDDANLLGGSHKFEIDNVPVNLPVVDADEEIMAFFGCKLIRKGDVVTFPELRRPFPVFCLQIGQKYMEKYILERDLGGGVFLEYHDDNPHFHAPLSRRSGGYLLLGVPSEDRRGKPPLPKCPDETQKVTLKVAGVRVPYGCAVYTPPGVLHADSACTGRWLIGYDQSTDFSTVLFRNKEDEVVKMSEMRITM